MKRTILTLQTIIISPIIAFIVYGLMQLLYPVIKGLVSGWKWYIKSLQKLGA
jgi:hypothetical protein